MNKAKTRMKVFKLMKYEIKNGLKGSLDVDDPILL